SSSVSRRGNISARAPNHPAQRPSSCLVKAYVGEVRAVYRQKKKPPALGCGQKSAGGRGPISAGGRGLRGRGGGGASAEAVASIAGDPSSGNLTESSTFVSGVRQR